MMANIGQEWKIQQQIADDELKNLGKIFRDSFLMNLEKNSTIYTCGVVYHL